MIFQTKFDKSVTLPLRRYGIFSFVPLFPTGCNMAIGWGRNDHDPGFIRWYYKINGVRLIHYRMETCYGHPPPFE